MLTSQTALMRRTLVLLGSASTLGFFAHAPAHAETAPTADATEVVVTATRRGEKSRDVPVAVTQISGEKLNVLNSSGQDIRLLSGRTPSLIAESSFGRTFPRFYIRGLGNTDFDVNAAQPVSVVYDDVALESPMLKSFPVFDLANVEVLRGPQGTLFGRNTPAGVVKIESAKPSETFGGYGSASTGTYGTTNLEGAITGPLGGGFSLRVSGQLQHRDDWVTNTAPAGLAARKLEGYNDSALRVQLAYASGDFDALINVHARVLDGTPRVFRSNLFKVGSNDFNTGFDVEQVALDGVTSQTLQSEGINLHLNWHTSTGTVRSITAFEYAKVESSGDIDGGYIYDGGSALNHAQAGFIGFDSTGGISKPGEFSQELRFDFDPIGNFRGQAGLYFLRQHLEYNELTYTNTGFAFSNIKHEDLSKNYGVFGSLDWKASAALTIRGGLRYSADQKVDTISGTPVATAVTLPVTTRVGGGNLSGEFSATYVLTPNVNIYGRIATGYLGPAIQDRVNFVFDKTTPTVAKEQTTISGEAGIKAWMFDKKVRIDADVYDFETKNLQVTAVGGSGNSAHLFNAAKAIGYGVELDLTAKPIDNLLITAGASYNYTEIKDPILSVGVCGSVPACTVTDPTVVVSGATLAKINGNPLPQAPKYVANFTAKYSWPLGNGAEVFAYTDWYYRSEVNFFLYEAKEFVGKPETIGGLRIGYVTPGGLEYAVFARNITNQIRAESAIDFDNLTGMVNDPRTYGVSIRKSF